MGCCLVGDRRSLHGARPRAPRRLQRRADRLPASMAVLFVRAVARPDRRRKGTRLPPRPRRVSGSRSVARSALGDRPYPVRGEGDHRLPTPPQGCEGTGPAHHRDRRTRQPQRGHDRAFQCVALQGIGSLGLDMPGTGEAPLKIGPNAERMFSAVIDYATARREIDASKLIVYGGSFGGHWGVRLAVTERERLFAVIVQSGPVHTAFQPEFLEKAFVTKEYLFDRGPALASMYDGVATPAELLEQAPKNSLLTQGYLDKPTVEPMLVIAGKHDTQVPISDIELLLHSGSPKWSWINPNGGHMGREAAGWVDPVIFQKITIPWILQVLGVRG